MSKKKTVVVVHRKGRRPPEQLSKLQAETQRTDQMRREFRQLQRANQYDEVWGLLESSQLSEVINHE